MNSKRPIIELTEELSNLISAGEVVESPLSIVKELVENSLDANATIIKVELTNAGLTKIVVSDNGFGMSKDEIPVALKRHATSKISSKDDLFNISSLGFRGEAIPSIASVSKMTISSCSKELEGYRFVYMGGVLIKESPVAMQIGTKIEIEDLFYNTPARFKHLRTEANELSHITSFINKLAIASPDKSISLYNNNKCLIKTTGNSDILEIVSDTYGKEVAKNLIYFSNHNNLYKIDGYTSTNAISRSNRNNISIFVNGRVIKNQSIIYAITDAYKTILPVGKYPITILNINCDFGLIDVNVHPSKLEIRFTDEYLLKTLITRTIGIALTKKELITDQLSFETKLMDESPLGAFETKKDEELPSEKLWEMFENYEDDKTQNLEEDIDEDSDDDSYDITPPKTESLFEEDKISYNDESLIKDKENDFFKNLVYLGQYLKTYLLMENDSNLYIIDQHAAMERYMYEKISSELSSDDCSTYELLVPITLEYNVSIIPLILEKINEIKKLNIELEEFGNNTILVRVIPTWIPKGLEIEFIRDIINHIILNKDVSKGKMYDSLAKTLACKKSIKANMSITELEVKSLMEKLDNCTMPYTCPHGRPTIIKFTKYELEKMFKRVM